MTSEKNGGDEKVSECVTREKKEPSLVEIGRKKYQYFKNRGKSGVKEPRILYISVFFFSRGSAEGDSGLNNRTKKGGRSEGTPGDDIGWCAVTSEEQF